ncbi:kelch-like protein 10 [Pangasianodon hypophthalmus]|uniref:kelch-like protein 10 n=1 Tax=Pangasianodon hypophthalmus TaxID=310915 RepID=UPI000EFFA795|nr:kelch-like protein 10 [Pangasianodon hypophthalmus]
MHKYTGQNMSKQEEEEEADRKVGMTACNIVNALRLEKKLCDVLITVDNAEFHAHKNILCGCSPYFRALFTNGWYPPDKHEYRIPDVSCETMELIMEYAYIQRVNITEENVCELLITADYLVVSVLVNECCAFLKAQLCLENCIGIWRFAQFYFCKKLKQQAFQFILHNFEEMVRVSEEFLDLTVEQLSEIIENDELNVKKENVVFEAILQWTEHSLQKRKAHIGELLPKVRMALLTHDYVMDNVRNNVLLTDNAACKPIVTSVMMGMYGLNTDESLSSDLARPRLPSAVLLAIGGWSRGSPTNAIEAYDTRAERWVDVTCNDESPRAYHGTVYLNGFVYCIGGFDSVNYFSSVRRFDPISRTWAQVGPMHSPRCYVSVCVLDGCIYAMGGFDGNERLNTVERYEPENNQWSMIAPMHERRSDASATVLDGKVYICGGFDGNDCLFTAEYYSPQTGQWTLITRMRSRRSGVGVIAYGGQVYAVGGFDGANRLRNAEAYNPQTNSWRRIPAMINQRSNFGIEVVDDLLFVVGGYNGFTTTYKVECYDQETAEWHAVEDMRIFRSALSCCVMSRLPNMAEYAAPRDVPYEVPQSSRSTRGYLTAPDNV